MAVAARGLILLRRRALGQQRNAAPLRLTPVEGAELVLVAPAPNASVAAAAAVVAFLVLLILRPENGKPADQTTHSLKKQFVIIHLVGFSFVLAGLLVRGSAIHLDTRFLRPAAIAVMPWVIPPLINRCRNGLTAPIRISTITG